MLVTQAEVDRRIATIKAADAMRPLRISFDIGGVLSKHPAVYRKMMQALADGGAEVYVITDMSDHERAVKLLGTNDFDVLPERVLCADWDAHGDMCKAELIRQHGIQVHVDDFLGYSAGAAEVEGCVSLLGWPDPYAPYYHEDFVCDDSVTMPAGLRRRKPRLRERDS